MPSDTYEPNHLRGNTESQIGTGPYVLTKYTPGQQAVFTRNDELLGHAGEDRQPDHPLLHEVVDDEARDPAGRDRHVVPVVHADRDHVAPEAEGPPGLQRAQAGASATSTMNVTRAPANNVAVRRAVAYLMPRQAIATQGLPRPGEAALLDGAGRLPGSHRRVRRRRTDGVPNPAKAKQVLAAGRSRHAASDRDLVDADALR